MKTKLILAFNIFLLTSCASAPEPMVDYTRPSVLEKMYQEGEAQRQAGQADECLQTFGKLIELRKMVKDSLYAHSLYQSGLCFEMKNEPNRAVGVYQDAMKVSAVMAAEFSQMEIPSRLAICYGKLGEKETSEKYYEISKKYLQKIMKDKKEFYKNKKHYAEVLFQMGSIANQYSSGIDFESYLRAVSYSQEYLTLVLELEVEPYSKAALEQMIDNISKTHDFIQNMAAPKAVDEMAVLREKQEKQNQFAETLLRNIDAFEALVAVNGKRSAEYKILYAKVAEIKKSLERIMSQRPVGEGLTPEAQRLQKIKIEGQLVPIPGDLPEKLDKKD